MDSLTSLDRQVLAALWRQYDHTTDLFTRSQLARVIELKIEGYVIARLTYDLQTLHRQHKER